MLNEQRGVSLISGESTEKAHGDFVGPLRNTPLLHYLSQHYPQVDRDTLRIARGLSLTHLMLMGMADDYLRPMGLSWSKLFVLLWLRAAQSEGCQGLAPSALSDCLAVTRNTVSTLLSGLERQGLITRAIDADDKRRFVMRLTPAGEAMADNSAGTLFSELQGVMSQVAAEDRGSLLATLVQIQQLLHNRQQASEQSESVNDE